MQEIVGPAEFECEAGVGRVCFPGKREVAERVFQESGVIAALAEQPGIQRLFGLFVIFEHQRHVQGHANTIGSSGIGLRQDQFEKRSGVFVAQVSKIEQSELCGGQVIVRIGSSDRLEFLLCIWTQRGVVL